MSNEVRLSLRDSRELRILLSCLQVCTVSGGNSTRNRLLHELAQQAGYDLCADEHLEACSYSANICIDEAEQSGVVKRL